MAEILLVRHAKSLANKRDFTAYGNVDSPLDPEKGIPQALALAKALEEDYGIVPKEYDDPVLVSHYRRTHETASVAGFTEIQINPILDETVFEREGLGPVETVKKHVTERWVPQDAAERAAHFIDLVRKGNLTHDIGFSHGILIASIKLQLVDEARAAGEEDPYDFDKKHGYIPDFATITPLTIE